MPGMLMIFAGVCVSVCMRARECCRVLQVVARLECVWYA